MKGFYRIISLMLVLLLVSCVKDLDFNQANDLELEPSAAISLANFELDQGDLSSSGTIFIPEIVDESLLPDFNNSLVQESLQSITMQFQGSNTFDDDFIVKISFLDVNNNETYALRPIVLEANEEAYTHEEDIEIATNPIFLNSHKIIIRLSYEGTFIDTGVPNSLVFRSAGIFNFRIN